MTIKEFIQTALNNEWKPLGHEPFSWQPFVDPGLYMFQFIPGNAPVTGSVQLIAIEKIFLDPLIWKAVFGHGIRMDMYEIVYEDQKWGYKMMEKPLWYWHMQRMIQALAEGKTLEEYIETL